MNALYWSVEYAASFIDIIFCFVFCGAFMGRTKIKDSKPQVVLLAAFGALITILIKNIELFSQITSIIGVLPLIAAQYFVYRKHPIKVLIFTLVYFTIVILLDISALYLMAYIAELPKGNVVPLYGFRLFTVMFSKSVLAVIVYAVNRITAKQSALPKQYLIALLMFSVFICALSLVIVFEVKDIHADAERLTAVSALFFLMALSLMLSMFFGALKMSDYYEKSKQAALLEMKNDMLQKAMDETEKTFSLWKTSLHDYKHNIFHLMALAEKGDMGEIKTYLAKENGLLSEKLFYYKSGNDAVDAILNVKHAIAREQGTAFLLNAAIPEKVKISDNHLCVILGNLIDNAINASKHEPEPYIEVSVKQIKGFLVIKVTNRYTQTTLQTLAAPDSKRYLRGIGLKSVGSIVKEYGGEFSATTENGLFVAEVIVSGK